jgi:hypothetical protein
MRFPAKLAVSAVCLGVIAGTPAVLAQAIPKALVRLCLRNLATGIACYVVGRGGELIVDGSLSAAWAKAKDTVTGEGAGEDDKAQPQRPPAPPSFKSPILEPIPPSELGSLSKRLPGSQAKNILTEGFLIYEAPKEAAPSLAPKPDAPKPGPTDASKPLSPQPQSPTHKPSPTVDPYLSPEAYRARNAETPSTALTAGRLGTLQSECQRNRERATGLSFLAILGAPDFDAKLQRRMEEVVRPCMLHGNF